MIPLLIRLVWDQTIGPRVVKEECHVHVIGYRVYPCYSRFYKSIFYYHALVVRYEIYGSVLKYSSKNRDLATRAMITKVVFIQGPK